MSFWHRSLLFSLQVRTSLIHCQLKTVSQEIHVTGHDTAATGLAWTLHCLSLNPGIRNRLRDEILAARATLAPGANLSSEDVSSLPYLDAVIVSVNQLY